MNQSSSDRPPLKTIEHSGIYVLRLCKPKPEKFKLNSAGFPAVSIFFCDTVGNCLNKNYSTQYGTKSIAMLVGKFTNQFVKAPEQLSLEAFTDMVNSAANCVAEVDLEVTPNGEWNGKPQFKYKFKSIKSILGNSNGQPTLNAEAPQVPDYSKPSESNPF